MTQAGVSREDSVFKLVQRNAMKVWEEGKLIFKTELLGDGGCAELRLSAREKRRSTRNSIMGYHTKHVDTIFKRVFGEG